MEDPAPVGLVKRLMSPADARRAPAGPGDRRPARALRDDRDAEKRRCMDLPRGEYGSWRRPRAIAGRPIRPGSPVRR